jgi:hypothetical protein
MAVFVFGVVTWADSLRLGELIAIGMVLASLHAVTGFVVGSPSFLLAIVPVLFAIPVGKTTSDADYPLAIPALITWLPIALVLFGVGVFGRAAYSSYQRKASSPPPRMSRPSP